MEKRHLQDNELDLIGQKLIRSGVLRTDEIERIAESPRLFAGVMNRVKATPSAKSRMFMLRPAFAASFTAIVCVLAAGGYFIIRQPVNHAVAPPVNPAPAPKLDPVKPVQFTKQTEPDLVSPSRSDSFAIPAQRAIIRKGGNGRSTGRKPSIEPRQELEFYPITYTGDPSENVNGGRVIRVEMSRASLFAMGVNVPIENGTELIKADLLVGPDGVPRAIRIPN